METWVETTGARAVPTGDPPDQFALQGLGLEWRALGSMPHPGGDGRQKQRHVLPLDPAVVDAHRSEGGSACPSPATRTLRVAL